MYILYHRSVRPTGRKIMQCLVGVNGRWRQPIPGDVLAMRWGSAMFPEIPSRIQDARAIMRASNKLLTLRTLRDAGVPVPDFTTRFGDMDGGTWLGRLSHGMCGRDIQVIIDGERPNLRGSDFYTRYIPNTREYRIHVYAGEVIGIMGKYQDYPEQAGDGYIKNYDHGYRYRTPNVDVRPARKEAAVEAVGALGLDFGAVDLILGEDGNHYVLEVNTAPGLAPLTARKYVERIADTLGVRIREDALGDF